MTNTYPQQPLSPEEQERRRQEQEKLVKEKREAGEKVLQEQRDQRDADNKARDDRSLNAKPTPTNDECDRAKLGILDIDNKEDDGSGPEPEPFDRRQRSMNPRREDRGDYKTRGTAKAKDQP